jgi:hypothetical protein
LLGRFTQRRARREGAGILIIDSPAPSRLVRLCVDALDFNRIKALFFYLKINNKNFIFCN